MSDIVSSNNMITNFINRLENDILGKNYEIDDSANAVFNTIISQLSENIEGAFFRYLLDKNEAIPLLAIQKRSLMKFLTIEEDFNEIFGVPASIKFILGFSVDELIKANEKQKENILTVNKSSTIKVLQSPHFSPIANINININKITDNNGNFIHNINAYYDFDEFDLFKKDNNAINSSVITIEGKKYFIMTIEGRQYEIKQKEFLIDKDKKYYTVDIDTNLFVFNVYKKVDNNLIKLNGTLEGTKILDNGYNFDLTDRNDEKRLKISLDQDKEFEDFDIIVIETIETEGTNGNLNFSNINDSSIGIVFELKQDIKKLSQKILAELQLEVSVISEFTSGGRNELTLEELRNKVINIKSGIRSNRIVTHNDIISIIKSKGFDIYKNRHDPLSIIYNIILKLKSSKFNVNLESNNGSLIIDSKENILPKGKTSNTRFILPFNNFKKVKNSTKKFELIDNILDDEYYSEYKKNNLEYFSFPYIIKLNTEDFLQTAVYDTRIQKEFDTIAIYQNPNSIYSADLFNISIESNPFDKDNQGYLIKFKIFVNEQIYNNVWNLAKQSFDANPDKTNVSLELNNDSLFKIRIKLINKNGESDYNLDPNKILMPFYQFNSFNSINDNTNNLLEFGIFLETDFDISENHDICIINKTLNPNDDLLSPVNNGYWINNFDLNIAFVFRHPTENVHTSDTWKHFLTAGEQDTKKYVGYVFESKGIQLVNNITKYFQFKSDMKLIPRTYRTYKETKYKVYEEVVYETDLDTAKPIKRDELNEIIPIDDPQYDSAPYSILHKVGDIKLSKAGNPIPLYLENDPILDADGKKIIESYQRNEYTILDVPLINKIYISKEFIDDICNSFNVLFNIIDELIIPDKINLLVKIKDINDITNWWYKSIMDGSEKNMTTLALSLSLGVKFKDNIEINSDLEKEKITLEIIEYINSFDGDFFSINKLLNSIKEKVYSIDYMELYKINNLGPNEIQSFYRLTDDEELDNSMLSVKLIIDKDDDGNKILKPDILIDII